MALRLNLLDSPGERSSHTRPTPTMGGLAILLAFLVGMIVARSGLVHWEGPPWIGWFLAGAGLVALVGFLDDLRKLPILVRLSLQGVGAGLLIAGGIRIRTIDVPILGAIKFGSLEIPITILWIIAVVNFYNFMDGIDGLAAGVGVIAAGFLTYIALKVQNTDVLVMGLLLGGSCAGFVWHNFPPAKVFMGDGGSTFIGYILAALGVVGNQTGSPGHIPLFVSVLLLGAFLFDTVVTLFRRILRREKWYLSHRDHYYQRMTGLGCSHLHVTAAEYGVTFLLGLSAILYIRANQIQAISMLCIWLMVLTGLTRLISAVEKKAIRERDENSRT
jgi:UDP-N-acetylmuramyl pentapeptide phosphotransferase/UDP-N-acetylglucosamine-1-phosphate transferase